MILDLIFSLLINNVNYPIVSYHHIIAKLEYSILNN